jgi:tetratricopeptide (TPR) repeat protein
VAFSPDLPAVAWGSPTGTIVLWDPFTRQLRGILEGHNGSILCLVYSPSRKVLLASAGTDKTVKLWDAQTDDHLRTLPLFPDIIEALAFSPGGESLACACADKKIYLWDWHNKEQTILSGHTGRVLTVAFSRDGKTLASGGEDKTIRLWESKTKGWELTLTKETGATIRAVSFAPDNRILAVAGGDHIELWDLKSNRVRSTLQGHTAPVVCLAFSRDGTSLFSGGLDSTVRKWRVANGKEDGFGGQLKSYVFLLSRPPADSGKPSPNFHTKLPRSTIMLEPGAGGGVSDFAGFGGQLGQFGNLGGQSGLQSGSLGSRQVEPLRMQIFRNGVLVQERTAHLDKGPLHLRAIRADDKLTFQVNNQESLVFHDWFPLPNTATDTIGLYWPGKARLDQFKVSRQTMPAAPSRLERADSDFHAGKFAEALRLYEAVATSSETNAGGQEARFKQGLCRVNLNQDVLAEARFQSVASGDGERWPAVALCHLWLLYLRQNDLTKADEVLSKLSARFPFEQLAVYVPEEVRARMTDSFRSAGGFDLHEFKLHPGKVAILKRCDQLEGIFHVHPEKRQETKYGLLKASSVSGDLDGAIRIGEEALALEGLSANRRMVILEDLVWAFLLKKQPQKALSEIERWLLKKPGVFQDEYIPLLHSRALVHSALGRLDRAEQDLQEFFRRSPARADETYLAACLVQGFLCESRGDSKAAQESWLRGYNLTKETDYLGLVSGALLASVSNQLTEDDARRMVQAAMSRNFNKFLVAQLAQLPLFPYSELAPVLREMWQTQVGKKLARKIAFHKVPEGEMFAIQGKLTGYEVFRQWAFAGLPTREQDEFVWDTSERGYQDFAQGKLTQEQLLSMAMILTFPSTAQDWFHATRQMDPDFRARVCYIEAHRFLVKKKPKEALELFRFILKENPVNSTVYQLSQIDMDQLKSN